MTKQYYSKDKWNTYPFNWPEFFQWRNKEWEQDNVMEETLRQFERKVSCPNNT